MGPRASIRTSGARLIGAGARLSTLPSPRDSGRRCSSHAANARGAWERPRPASESSTRPRLRSASGSVANLDLTLSLVMADDQAIWRDAGPSQLERMRRRAVGEQLFAAAKHDRHREDAHSVDQVRSRMARGRAAMSFDSRAKCLEVPFMLLPFFGGPTPRLSGRRRAGPLQPAVSRRSTTAA
jgi:hypothetical protein